MKQELSKQELSLFPHLESTELPRPVNVASVPQRSPFRYPGGKTWFVPTFRRWMASLNTRPRMLVEPFAGGGIISLTALFEDWVERVVMVELDHEVAAVWQAIVQGHASWLASRILEFQMTREAVEAELSKMPESTQALAFQTILKNRTLHGGILAEGASFIRYGENNKGIGSRWYPQTLARRLGDLNRVAHRIDFRQADGLKVMAEFANAPDIVYFIDPPYTAGGKKAGRRLYKHYQLDHEALFTMCESLVGDFLMTYDEAEEVKAMARRHGFEMRLIPMKGTHNVQMHELIVGRDLSWLTGLPVVRDAKATYRARKPRSNKPTV